MNTNGARPRESKVLPRAHITTIQTIDTAYQLVLEQIASKRPKSTWQLITPRNFTDAEKQMCTTVMNQFTDEEKELYAQWCDEGRPTLIPQRSMREVMAELGIPMPDDDEAKKNLPARSDQATGEQIKTVPKAAPRKAAPKPAPVSSQAKMELAMMISNRRYKKSWDALDEQHKKQVWDEAGIALEAAG